MRTETATFQGKKQTKKNKQSAVTAANSIGRRWKEQGICHVSAHQLSMCQSDAETCRNSTLFIWVVMPWLFSSIQVGSKKMTVYRYSPPANLKKKKKKPATLGLFSSTNICNINNISISGGIQHAVSDFALTVMSSTSVLKCMYRTPRIYPLHYQKLLRYLAHCFCRTPKTLT